MLAKNCPASCQRRGSRTSTAGKVMPGLMRRALPSVTPGTASSGWHVSANAMPTRPMPTPVRYASRGMTGSPLAAHPFRRRLQTVALPPSAAPADPDSGITKMEDGMTHLAHKAEHVVDLPSDLV